jgi:hypothetical protein
MVSANLEELYMLGKIIWFSVIILLTLSYVTVGLRLWVRYRITKSAGMDDAAMVITLVSCSACSIRPKRVLMVVDAIHVLLYVHRCHYNREDLRATLVVRITPFANTL